MNPEKGDFAVRQEEDTSPAAGWRGSPSSRSRSGLMGVAFSAVLLETNTGGIRGHLPVGVSPRAAGSRDRAHRADASLRGPPTGSSCAGGNARNSRATDGWTETPASPPSRSIARWTSSRGSRDERPASRAARSAAGGVHVRVRRRHAALLRHRNDDARGDLRLPPGAALLVRSRRRTPGELTARAQGSASTELTLIGALLTVFIVFWIVGATQYDRMMTPPPDALPVYVTAKQWMWKFSYPDGRSSMDVLTVPVGRPIKLVMTSRDVIHSFYVPAFRMKHDVLPGRYYAAWFEATHAGHLRHPVRRVLRREPLEDARQSSRVLSADDYASLAGDARPPGESRDLAARRARGRGRARGCLSCHTIDGQPHIGPDLGGPLRVEREARRRAHGRRRRGVPDAVDDGAGRRRRRGLQAGHADVPRRPRRAGGRRARGAHHVACRTGRSRRASRCRAVVPMDVGPPHGVPSAETPMTHASSPSGDAPAASARATSTSRTTVQVLGAHDRPQAHRRALPRLDVLALGLGGRLRARPAHRAPDARADHHRRARPTTACSRCTASSWCGSS